MKDQSTANKLPSKDIEPDILKAVDERGPIELDKDKKSCATDQLLRKYSSAEESRRVRAVLNALVKQELLHPFYERYTTPRLDTAMGITPKGLDRLYRLEHTYLSFVKDNWFKLFVAAPAALASIAIAANTILN